MSRNKIAGLALTSGVGSLFDIRPDRPSPRIRTIAGVPATSLMAVANRRNCLLDTVWDLPAYALVGKPKGLTSRTGSPENKRHSEGPAMPDRSIFLHAPAPGQASARDEAAARRLGEANRLLRETFPGTGRQAANELLFAEARHSAAIEGEHRKEAVLLHHEALLEYVQAPVSQAALLDMHRAMMAGQHHAQPGRYRTSRAATGLNPVAQSAWAHLQFETIHPFADGNGRAGRALINQLLEAPLPLSKYILRHRQEYYRLLGAGDWHTYLDWFVTGVMEQALSYRESKRKKSTETGPHTVSEGD